MSLFDRIAALLGRRHSPAAAATGPGGLPAQPAGHPAGAADRTEPHLDTVPDGLAEVDRQPARAPSPASANAATPASAAAALGLDLIDLLARVLEAEGQASTRDGERLHLPEGFELGVELLEVSPTGDGRQRTASLISARHPAFGAVVLPEYAHSSGRDAEEALARGFITWARMELVTLRDALKAEAPAGTRLEMAFDAKTSATGRPLKRQVLLGPVGHLVTQAPDPAAAAEAHPFCPCCLLTQSLAAFDVPLRRDQTLGIKLFAAVDDQGVASADCRINGVDWPAGTEALVAYARTWPARGLETRKQYVVVRTVG